MQSFAKAAADSFGSGSSSGHPGRKQEGWAAGDRPKVRGVLVGHRRPVDVDDDPEVQSPLKAPPETIRKEQGVVGGKAGRKLNLSGEDNS